jgi:hypothetical protein
MTLQSSANVCIPTSIHIQPFVQRTAMSPPGSDVIERFWAHVDRSSGEDADWDWLGTIRRDGYGSFRLPTRQVVAHRFAYELTYGPIPHGLFVTHTCSNRRCCNPKHLRLMTRSESMAARSRKPRS